MRTLPSPAGPVDAGPTVMTMRQVFDQLFRDVGTTLEAHLTLEAEPILARHFWPDGTTLDLMQDTEQSAENIAAHFGRDAAAEFTVFCARTARLFDAFDAPMMQAAAPTLASITRDVIGQPALIRDMAPHRSLAGLLRQSFTDPRLAQLFGRYATYVGGIPGQAPALLALVWEAERRGVWHVRGGMHRLAQAIERLAHQRGARFHYDTHVTRIEVQAGRTCALHTADERVEVDAVVFNGDPNALHEGLLGHASRDALPTTAVTPRSLSAHVQAFAATVAGDYPLAAHNVFFADDPAQEYGPLARGDRQDDPTLYLCAQDRFGGATHTGAERFEIILNAPPTPGTVPDPQEQTKCQKLIFERLAGFGLRFSPAPDLETLTGPQGFATLFPGSTGSLYGRSPQGMMAAFQRPTARSKLKGLYLTGGGAHPGAGVPMATLSAAHAAAAITSDLGLTSPSLRAATLGGMSTV